jgi:hypothetical protein
MTETDTSFQIFRNEVKLCFYDVIRRLCFATFTYVLVRETLKFKSLVCTFVKVEKVFPNFFTLQTKLSNL